MRVCDAIVPCLRLLLELVHWRHGHHVPAHDLLAEVPGQLLGVVLGMLPVADVEHSVQFFKRKSLGLGKQEVAVDEAEQVPGSIPAESAGWCEGSAQTGPGEGDDEVEAPAGRGGERHADVANVQREGLSGVSERHRTFGRRVDSHERKDRSSDGTELAWVAGSVRAIRWSIADVEAEAGPEEADGHERETDQEKVTTSECINGIDAV